MTALDWSMVGFITIIVTIGLTVFIKELLKDVNNER